MLVPNTRPTLTRETLLNIAREHGVGDSMFLVGIRNHFRDSLGKPGVGEIGIYDDAIFVVSPRGAWGYNANTDPSVQRKGVATLAPGVHLYTKGKHGITRAHPYPALRPDTPGEKLPVIRDGKPSVGVAINIHRGSLNSTSSLGCQTIYPTEWQEFIDKVYNEMDGCHQKSVKYILIEKPNLVQR